MCEKFENVVNKDLLEYIKDNVFPVYNLNGKSHDLNHIKYVLKRAFEISIPYEKELNYDMLYTAVSFHDIGDHIDRANHEKVSAKWMFEDKNLEKFFSEEQRVVIKEAIEDHRSSSKNTPRNLYGKILASADKSTDINMFFKRSYEYGLEHYKDLNQEQQLQRVYEHAVNKFGKEGYAVTKYYVEDKKYAEYLKELQYLIDNKQEFFDKCKKVLNIK